MRQTRVTVFLRERRYPASDGDADITDHEVFMWEWVHAVNAEMDETGISFHWDDGSEGSSFFPWPSVLRVDREPCFCGECESETR